MDRSNLTYYLAERPSAEIIPGKTFQARTEPAPTADDLKEGDALVESLYLSLDPAARDGINSTRSYGPPVEIGARMRATAIVRVLSSKTAKVKAGDIVCAPIGWTEVAIVPEAQIDKFEVPKGSDVTERLCALGGVGLTAYFGITTIALPKPGETIVVSSAAGAVGSFAGQIAKIFGARVVGIAGTDEKCAWLRDDMGFDAALNYKSPSFKEELAAATPDFVDMYWDNVGGELLDAVLERAAKGARFVLCGAISGYNSETKQTAGVRNLTYAITQRVTLKGFIVFDHLAGIPRAREEISRWIEEGKLKSRVTIVRGGLKEVEAGIAMLYRGGNIGKTLLEVKSPGDE
ncbi:zinc-binding dehydrogenase [Hypoxylon rubiginosum]|uniref:Zinc-binding dehydrogenase n=1 Tax=Hypoxylon rubiginosum TaxID=110542 RepID=A0ACB9Z8D2_9PEZI|nr:zinc-binding dehydrogenase [Hypoxylon rubiginosum]